jgi:hypothetical protein
MFVRIALGTTLLFAVVSAAPARADATEKSCDEILKAAETHATMGVDGGSARMTLVIRGPRGDERRRALEIQSAREDGLSRMLVRFTAPDDVAGTAFLLREREGGADEQVLYLPALQRTRRITGSQRRGAFMGTDFSYADLEVRRADRSTCQRLDDEEVEGQPAYVIEVSPETRSEDDPYAKAKMWIHQRTMVPLRVDLYGDDGEVEKRMQVHRLERVSGRWMATETTMETLARGSRTLLRLDEVDPDARFPPETFTERALTR